jgi:hypothetical protein
MNNYYYDGDDKSNDDSYQDAAGAAVGRGLVQWLLFFINPSEKTLHFNARDESVFYFSPKLCYTKYIVVRTDSVEVEETIHWSTTKLFNNLDRWLQK